MPAADLAYVINGSATDGRSWSGLHDHILGALRVNGVNPFVVDNLASRVPLACRLVHLGYRMRGQSYLPERDARAVGEWARVGARRLATVPEVRTVVVTGAIPGVALPAKYDLAIWCDATFNALRTTYPEYQNLASASIRSGDDLDRRAYERARLVCFASDWAAADAVRYYGVDRAKVAVVPFGANCEAVLQDESSARLAIDRRSRRECHIVFQGVDWHRKGGTVVLETAELLRRRGMPVRVTIVGVNPPRRTRLPGYVTALGHLDKRSPDGRSQWDRVMRSAHVLFVPSQAECFGLVYAEAAAHAVPSVARLVGGVAAAVRDGLSGRVLPATATPADYGDAIESLWSDPDHYAKFALNAWRVWRDELNWQSSGRRFLEHLFGGSGSQSR